MIPILPCFKIIVKRFSQSNNHMFPIFGKCFHVGGVMPDRFISLQINIDVGGVIIAVHNFNWELIFELVSDAGARGQDMITCQYYSRAESHLVHEVPRW